MSESNLYEILRANESFLASGENSQFQTDKLPDRRMVIVTCMDTRLVELLERAMGINQGDAKVIKVAGARVQHPFGSAMHSILVAVHMLEADEVFIVAHHDCGMRSVEKEVFVERMMEHGIKPQTIQMMEHSGIDIDKFLERFDNVYDSVRSTVDVVRHHPFLEDAGVPVHGLVIDPATGKLELVVDGYRP